MLIKMAERMIADSGIVREGTAALNFCHWKFVFFNTMSTQVRLDNVPVSRLRR